MDYKNPVKGRRDQSCISEPLDERTIIQPRETIRPKMNSTIRPFQPNSWFIRSFVRSFVRSRLTMIQTELEEGRAAFRSVVCECHANRFKRIMSSSTIATLICSAEWHNREVEEALSTSRLCRFRSVAVLRATVVCFGFFARLVRFPCKRHWCWMPAVLLWDQFLVESHSKEMEGVRDLKVRFQMMRWYIWERSSGQVVA